MRLRKTWWVLAALAAAALGIIAGSLPFVPAAYLASVVEGATSGRVILAETAGTVWNGSARVALTNVARTETRRFAVLPGTIAWQFDEVGLAPVRVALRVGGTGAVQKPFRIAWSLAGLNVEPGGLRVPAPLLETIGAPFNTLRPGGELTLTWDTLSWRPGNAQGGVAGTLVLDWTDARSAASPVAPLGSYRLTARGEQTQVMVDLATITGPLVLSGSGQWTMQHGMQFHGEARAEPARRAELAPLIGLLGRRSANGAELRF